MINKCTFIGNLGKDPDYKVLESGHKVASFSIACSRKIKNKENGETKEYTEWIPIVAWDNLAEIISQLARKGSQVYVEGEFRTRSYIIVCSASYFAGRFRQPARSGFCYFTRSAGTSGSTAACAGNA